MMRITLLKNLLMIGGLTASLLTWAEAAALAADDADAKATQAEVLSAKDIVELQKQGLSLDDIKQATGEVLSSTKETLQRESTGTTGVGKEGAILSGGSPTTDSSRGGFGQRQDEQGASYLEGKAGTIGQRGGLGSKDNAGFNPKEYTPGSRDNVRLNELSEKGVPGMEQRGGGLDQLRERAVGPPVETGRGNETSDGRGQGQQGGGREMGGNSEGRGESRGGSQGRESMGREQQERQGGSERQQTERTERPQAERAERPQTERAEQPTHETERLSSSMERPTMERPTESDGLREPQQAPRQ